MNMFLAKAKIKAGVFPVYISRHHNDAKAKSSHAAASKTAKQVPGMYLAGVQDKINDVSKLVQSQRRNIPEDGLVPNRPVSTPCADCFVRFMFEERALYIQENTVF